MQISLSTKNMRSLQPRNRGRFGLARIGIAVALLGAGMLAVYGPAWLDRFIIETAVSTSVVRTALADSADTVRTGMMSLKDVVAELQRLREENTMLRMRAALYDEVVAERNRLYERFGRDSTVVGVYAGVLASPARSPYDTLLLDVGSSQGVARGDEVLFDTTLSIGVIEEVSEHGSRVRLFSSPGVENQVSIGTSTALFTAVGHGGGVVVVSVPKDVVVEVGDALMLAGTHRGALGFVRSIESRDADAFQTIYAASPINLFETRGVLVVNSLLHD